MNPYCSPFERVAFPEDDSGTIRTNTVKFQYIDGEWLPSPIGRLKQYRFDSHDNRYVSSRYIYLNEPTEEELKEAGVTCEEAFIFLRLLKLYRKVCKRAHEYRENVFFPLLKEAQKQSPLFYRTDYDTDSVRVIDIDSNLGFSRFTSNIEELKRKYGGDVGLYVDMAVCGPNSPDYETNIARLFEIKADKSAQYWQLYYTLRDQLNGVVHSAFKKYHNDLIEATENSILPNEQIVFEFCGFAFYIKLKYTQIKCPREVSIVWSDIDPYMECETR